MMKNEPAITSAQIAVVAASKISAAKEAEAEAKAEVKEQEKWAIKRGVNLTALRDVVKAIKGGTHKEFVEYLRDAIAYAHAFASPVERSQIDMFNTLEQSLPLDESARLKGHAAALEGEPTTKCPYGLDSSTGQQWMAGWHDGERIRGMINAIGADELIKSSEPEVEGDEGDNSDEAQN